MAADAPADRQRRCLGCSYILDGVRDPCCPECGRGFDPADPKTWTTGRDMSRLLHSLLRPPRWLIGVAGIAAIILLLAFSAPFGGILFGTMAATALALITAATWAARLTLAIGVLAVYRRPPVLVLARWWRWLMPAIILAAATAIVASDIPSRTRFRFARPALDRFAEAALSLPSGQNPPQECSVGTYRLRQVQRRGRILTAGLPQYGFLDWPCLAYCPDGPPTTTELGSRTYDIRHLSGHWYSYWFRF
jgi:hypothetical protein